MPANLTRIDNMAAGFEARDAALRASEASGLPTPGQYMQKQRKAAGVSRAEVARRLAANAGARPQIEMRLEDLENDLPGNHAQLVRTLQAHRVFPFNIAMFTALAAATCAPSLGEWDPA